MSDKPTPEIRSKINNYTSAVIIGVSSFAFMSVVNFLPGAPIFPILVSVLLFFASLYRSPKWSSGILAIIVFVSILYQITGFMVWTVKSEAGLSPLIFSVGALLFNLFSARKEATSMAIAVLAVAVMFTPYYYLSIAFIVAAAVIGGLSSIGPVSLTYVITMAPLLFIENGFISGGTPQGVSTPPLLFGQLTNFATNMRPPLPGLNLFLTWYPPNFFDASVAAPVVNYMSSAMSFLLLVPLLILAIVFVLSAGVAGVINDMLNKLSIFERTSQLLKLISPLVASIVTPLTFFILITTLSQKSIGGYDSSLASGAMLSMVTTSLILGTVFTAREYGIQWLERTEKARIKVIEKIATIRELMKPNKDLIARAMSEVPSINYSTESKMIEETESSMDDIQKGLSTASYETLHDWIDELDNVAAQKMKSLPEAIRVKIVSELNYLSSLVFTYNNSLKEAGLNKSFAEPAETKVDLEFVKALEDYPKLIEEIKSSSSEIFEIYKNTYNAYNVIASQLNMFPPVDPTRLFESNDFDGGVKLLAEEYWLNFHIKNQPELIELVGRLSETCVGILPHLDDKSAQGVESVLEKLKNPKPVDSISILEDIKTLKGVLDSAYQHIVTEIEQLSKLVNSLPGASRVINFEVFNQSQRLTALKQKNIDAGPNLRDTAAVMEEAMYFMKSYRESKKNDEGNLIIISQLPVAMKVILRRLIFEKNIDVSDLPFQHKAAVIYAAFSAYNNQVIRYDEENEVIRRKNA